MSEVGAVVDWLPRLATLPTPGDPDSYRLTPERARSVRERLCRELLSAVPPSALFPPAAAPSAAAAFSLLDQCDWHLGAAQQKAESAMHVHEATSVPALPEYSRNRRGMTCGHVFRKGEPIFRCHDCSFDDTCVQCATCFRHSIHAREEHDVLFSVADEGGACCDCGDDEAWNRDLGCEFHSLHPHNEPAPAGTAPQGEQTIAALLHDVPADLHAALSDWTASLLAFVLTAFLHAPKPTPPVMGPDVISEMKRQPTLEHAFPDKGKARLDDGGAAAAAAAPSPPPPLFVALLWNDEKHSFNEVSDKIQEVVPHMSARDARHFAEQVDRRGREVVALTDDVRRLVLMARRIGVIYLLVTIQPAFDYFVEEVAGCALEFLSELASCSLWLPCGSDGRAVKALLTETLLRPWRVPEWEAAPAHIRRDLFDPTQLCILDTLLLLDTKMWKAARMSMRRLMMDLIACREAKRQVALRVAAVYPRIIETFILHDREPEHSIYHMTVQLFSVPSVAAQLVVERRFLVVLLYVLQAFFANESDVRLTSLVLPAPLPPYGQANPDTALLRQQKCYHIFYDIRYLLGAGDVQRDVVRHVEQHLGAWLEFFALFHAISPDTRAAHTHVEFESELWIQVFHINSHLGRIAKLLGEAFVHADEARLCDAVAFTAQALLSHMDRLSALNPAAHPPHETHRVDWHGHAHEVVRFAVSSQPVSFHHPMHWLLAEMLKHLHERHSTSVLRSALLDDGWLRLIEHPLRVAVKLSQIRCNVWVRNGFAIRSQAYHYRDSMWMRDIMYDQDLFLQQFGLACLPAERFLATALDRFELTAWFRGEPHAPHAVYDAEQLVFMAEELLFLLAVLLNEISVPAHWPIEAQVQRELVHYLALGPCTYSELTKQIPERFTDHGCFDRVLAQVAHFRQPDGSADLGMYELRDAYYRDVQPFFHHYSRNQREKAEQVLARKRQQGGALPMYPTSQLQALQDTPFYRLADVFVAPMLVDMLATALRNATRYADPPDTLVNVVLHLLAQGLEERGAAFAELLARDSTNIVPLLLELAQHAAWQPYHDKLTYVTDKAASLHEPLATAVATARGPKPAVSKDDKRREAAKARQAAILASFSQQQQSLLAELEDELSSDEESDEHAQCILCQERLDATRAYGTLIHLQESRLVRLSRPRDHAAVEDVLATPLDLARGDRSDPAARARGRPPPPTNGAQLGYPAAAHKTGLVAVSCGHAMHVACFHTYLQSTEQRHAMQVARNHPEDLARFEYVCPLCKSLGNVLLPPPDGAPPTPPLRTAAWGDVAFDATPLADWVRRINISILKHTPADAAWRSEHQDTARGTGCFWPWLLLPSAQPHHPDLGAGVLPPDACHMLQRFTHVVELLADETKWARARDRQANALEAQTDGDALYLPDSLVAYTLAQMEIAQRGLPGVSEAASHAQLSLVRSLLDVLSTLAHVALTSEHGAESMRHGLLKRLLPHWASESAVRLPLLLRQPLGVLVEAAVLLPSQFLQVTALLYYVQLVQVIFGLAQPVSAPCRPSTAGADLDDAARIFPHARWLVTSIVSLVGYVRGNMTLGFDQLSDRDLAKALCSYTLPFLRRAALLRRAIAGTPPSEAPGATEYEQLLAELQIPPPTTALPMHAQPSELLTMLVEGWIKHAYAHLAPLFQPLPIQPSAANTVPSLALEHPHIYELLPLPLNLTDLLQQTQERKCQRCGMLPPTFSLCLFCGDVLCEQSFCCSDPDDESRGECNQHMEHCGGRVSLHFRVGSNAVVMLYQSNGAFASSPYLNSHGEVDRYLLKARPQRLHQQRYDELRKQWLTHGIANIVTRRIEATMDQGGWITF